MDASRHKALYELMWHAYDEESLDGLLGVAIIALSDREPTEEEKEYARTLGATPTSEGKDG